MTHINGLSIFILLTAMPFQQAFINLTHTLNCHEVNKMHIQHYMSRDVHYGTIRGSAIFWNLYFESRISNPIPE